MHQHQIEKTIDELVVAGEFSKARDSLIGEYERSKRVGDKEALDFTLNQLVFVCSATQPPSVTEGRQFCEEREANINTAYNALQSGLFELYISRDFTRAVDKLRNAEAKGKQQRDFRTAYSALAHLGEALAEIGQIEEIKGVLNELEQFLKGGEPFVVGDETGFLEKAYSKGMQINRIRKLAAELAPICKDRQFRERLEVLASIKEV